MSYRFSALIAFASLFFMIAYWDAYYHAPWITVVLNAFLIIFVATVFLISFFRFISQRNRKYLSTTSVLLLTIFLLFSIRVQEKFAAIRLIRLESDYMNFIEKRLDGQRPNRPPGCKRAYYSKDFYYSKSSPRHFSFAWGGISISRQIHVIYALDDLPESWGMTRIRGSWYISRS